MRPLFTTRLSATFVAQAATIPTTVRHERALELRSNGLQATVKPLPRAHLEVEAFEPARTKQPPAEEDILKSRGMTSFSGKIAKELGTAGVESIAKSDTTSPGLLSEASRIDETALQNWPHKLKKKRSERFPGQPMQQSEPTQQLAWPVDFKKRRSANSQPRSSWTLSSPPSFKRLRSSRSPPPSQPSTQTVAFDQAGSNLMLSASKPSSDLSAGRGAERQTLPSVKSRAPRRRKPFVIVDAARYPLKATKQVPR